MKIANVLINDKYIKPLIFLGSERSSTIYVLNQITLEIIYQFRFKTFTGGFTNAEILGETVFSEGVFCFPCTDNRIRIIDIRETYKYSKGNECKEHFHDSQIIEMDVSDVNVLLKVPKGETVMSMSS